MVQMIDQFLKPLGSLLLFEEKLCVLNKTWSFECWEFLFFGSEIKYWVLSILPTKNAPFYLNPNK